MEYANTIEEIRKILEVIPLPNSIESKTNNLLGASGGIFNSAARNFKKGDFYLIGLNPGRAYLTSDEIRVYSIERNLDKFNEQKHLYTEDNWGKHPIGQDPFQKSVGALFDAIGADLNETCCSNLYFIRTKDQDELEGLLKGPLSTEIKEAHMEVHRLILDVVQPKNLVFFSALAYYEFKKLMGAEYSDPNQIIEPNSRVELPSGHGKWKIRIRRFRLKDGTRYNVIWVPHFSYYRFHTKSKYFKQEIGNTIRNYIESER